jgi:hypothetical protein
VKISGKASMTQGGRSQLAKAGLAFAVAPLAALAVIAAGCGGSSGAGGAQADSTQTMTTSTELSGSSKRQALVAFSACMRRNGVPDFPDPESSGGGMKLSSEGTDANTPQFKNAQQACKRLLPNGGNSTPQERADHLREALGYADCMRTHGVPEFPDPKLSGDGGVEWGELGPRFGTDPNSPRFKAAQDACKQLAPGASRPDAGDATP